MRKLNNTFHLSLDDVGSVLFSEKESGISPLSNFINYTHHEYNCIWGLNFFTKWDGGNVFDCDIGELINKEAGFIGCHSPDKHTKPYELSFAENQKWIWDFYQAVNSYDVNLSRFIRFHYYSELFECGPLLKSLGIEGMFLTDRPEICYHLPDKEKKILKKRGTVNFQGLDLYRTHFRLEWVKELHPSRNDLINLFSSHANKSTPLVIYGHEYEFRDPALYKLTELVIDVLTNELGFECLTP
jgi:hypothetical protein